MLTIRRAADRGKADFGWLKSSHSFSFGNYYDPQQMGFSSLRVINEDQVAGGGGFAPHGHRDMEIISYVLSGALEHQDSLGTGSVIQPGDVQRMSAGSGIRHSEYNHSKTDPVHFLQIWVLPEAENLEPSYEQKHFTAAEKQGQLRLVGSRDGRDGSVVIHQDVNLYAAILEPGLSVPVAVGDDRGIWVQVLRGAIEVLGQRLVAGDGASLVRESELLLVGAGAEAAELLVFDLVGVS